MLEVLREKDARNYDNATRLLLMSFVKPPKNISMHNARIVYDTYPFHGFNALCITIGLVLKSFMYRYV